MKPYKEFRPTGFDCAGLCADEIGADWLVVPVSHNRDADCLSQSNFAVALKMLGGEGDNVQVHRFGHWSCGWFEIIIVRSGTYEAKVAEDIEKVLKDYPVLDDEDFSRREQESADEVWKNCYSWKERAAYIREHYSQFEFQNWRDVLSCIRGKRFAGYAGELLN